MLQVCRASPSSRDIDGNKYETLLSNPPVEQNLVHGSFCNDDDCYTTKTKSDDKDATAVNGCKRLVEKIISSLEPPPLIEELRSLSKFTSDNNGITKKSAAALPSAEINAPTASEKGKENNLPIIDVSCLRKIVTSDDGENENGIVRIPVIRRIFRFVVHNNPPSENVPNSIVKSQEENLVLHPLVHTELPKPHSTVLNDQGIILRKFPSAESNIHVLPLLTPFSVRNEHNENDGNIIPSSSQGLLHPLLNNINYITPSIVEHYIPTRVPSYALERPKLPEIVHLAKSQTVLPIPLYSVVVKEPFHPFEDSQLAGAHLHTTHPSEANVPVSQWWYPISSPTYSKKIYYVPQNNGQSSPSGYEKKDTSS